MKSNYDFEQLVFEKAGVIKAHDRRRRIVLSTVTPVAAALVILTAAGLRTLSFSPNSTADFRDAAVAGINELYPESGNALKPHEDNEAKGVRDNNADFEMHDNAAQENDAYEVEGAEMYSEEEQSYKLDSAPSLGSTLTAPNSISHDSSTETVIFTANETIALYDEAAEEVKTALVTASADKYASDEIYNDREGLLGVINIGSAEYSIFNDHAEVKTYGADDGADVFEFALDDETKATLEKNLPIYFG